MRPIHLYRTFYSLKILKYVATMPPTVLAFHLEKLKNSDLCSTSCVGSMSMQKGKNQNLVISTGTSDARALWLHSTLTLFRHSHPHFIYHEAQIKFNEHCGCYNIVYLYGQFDETSYYLEEIYTHMTFFFFFPHSMKFLLLFLFERILFKFN